MANLGFENGKRLVDLLQDHKYKFISKKCKNKNTFGGNNNYILSKINNFSGDEYNQFSPKL